jgi:hypothetical protein
MMKQKRFAAVETLLIILILAVAAVGGYLIWNNISKHDKAVSTVTSFEDCAKTAGSVIQESFPEVCVAKEGQRFIQKVSSAPKQSCSLDNGWLGQEVSDLDKKFTFCQPSGWLLLFVPGYSGYFASSAGLKYDASKTPLQQETGGSDNMYSLYINTTTADDSSVRTGDYTKTGTLKTSAYLVAAKYYHLTGEQDPVGAGIDYLPKDTKQYLYVITKGESELIINYIVEPGQTDELEAIESFAASVQ